MGQMHVLITFFYSILLYLTFTPFATSVYFKISSFGSNNDEILYRGSAVPSSGAVQFTPVNYVCQVGQVIYADRVQMWDSSSGKVSDFTTRFSFTIDTINQPTYGDGFAFFLGPTDFQIPPNSAGSFLGLYNLSNYRDSSQNQIIHVEFDSFVDSDWDPPYEHVGINKNSIFSANNTDWSAGNHSGNVADVTISYNSQTMMFIVSCTYNNPPPPETSTVSYHVDLKEVLTEWVTIGFSAGTGNLKEKNTLLYWEFDSSLNGKWPGTQKKETSGIGISRYIVPGVIGAIVGMVIAMVVFVILKKGWIKFPRRRNKKAIQEEVKLIRRFSSTGDTESEIRPPPALPVRYSYSDLHLATNGFSDDNRLGEGGFGVVYKCLLPISAHQEVAVKKISEGSTQGVNEYTAEVETIGKLNHPNLVELVGWCDEEGKFLLVYKKVSNGSLDSYLFGNKGPLDWSNRYKIAFGLACALHYLHEEQGEKYVIHRDIKPSNVMLDPEFNPKLGDFGLARVKDSNEEGSKTTKVAGTLGYFAPEYVSTGKVSKATDMYSFGVTLLEIGSGRSVEDQTSNIGLVKWVWDLYGEKQLRSTVDDKLSYVDEKEYNCLMMVGLACTHGDPKDRLTIDGVIHALQNVIPPQVPLVMPAPRYDKPSNHPSTSKIN